MIGYIDRLSKTPDGIIQIHDFKTSANLPSQNDADTDRQLALYQLGIQQKWPDYNTIHLIWHYLAFDMELVSSRSPEAINELAWNTIKLIDEIEGLESSLETQKKDFEKLQSSHTEKKEQLDKKIKKLKKKKRI